MATIIEKTKDGKIVSFKIMVLLGRDEKNKQRFKCKTWRPEKEMSKSQSRREAEKWASVWEKKVKQEYLSSKEETDIPKVRSQKQVSFSQFTNEIWMPLAVKDGEHCNTTVAMYQHILNVIMPFFKDNPLNEITPIQISQYLQWLRKEYRTNKGKPVSASTVKHHYDILKIIFTYAEKNDFIQYNPMCRVDTPKTQRKKVDALTIEEAERFFHSLGNCNLEFRCILMIMITTGLRRGECVGLQWQDISFESATVIIQRSVTYTSTSGIEIKPPKTNNSIRIVPLMQSVLQLLTALRYQREFSFPDTDLAKTFLFCRADNPFIPREPTCITRLTKQFFKKSGLPDMSPHDLRHSCASLLLANGADIKSVQEILGHADARTTLNYYVRADIEQARLATEKYANAFGL